MWCECCSFPSEGRVRYKTVPSCPMFSMRNNMLNCPVEPQTNYQWCKCHKVIGSTRLWPNKTNVFYCFPLSPSSTISVQNKVRFICMKRTTFHDTWVGGVLVKTWIIALRRSTFWKKNKSTTSSNLVFYLGWLICSLSYIIIVPTLK